MRNLSTFYDELQTIEDKGLNFNTNVFRVHHNKEVEISFLYLRTYNMFKIVDALNTIFEIEISLE